MPICCSTPADLAVGLDRGEVLVERDALGHRATAGIDIFALPHDPGHRVDEFMRWFAAVADDKLVAAHWWTSHLDRAFNSGIAAGAKFRRGVRHAPVVHPVLERLAICRFELPPLPAKPVHLLDKFIGR